MKEDMIQTLNWSAVRPLRMMAVEDDILQMDHVPSSGTKPMTSCFKFRFRFMSYSYPQS